MAAPSDNSRDPSGGGHDVWVLAGQSNMQGCGWLEGALAPDDRVWSFSSAGRWERAEEPLHRLWESFTPVHHDLMRPSLPDEDRELSNETLATGEEETRTIGAGLGISFGIAMSDATGRPIGLIPAAHGGTTLDQWSPDLKHRGGHSLYGAMLERIRRAGGKLKGILWYQGESDGGFAELGRTYADRFDAWVAAVRQDVGSADLPVIAVQIGRVVDPPDRAASWPGWNMVREALRTLPERVSHTAVTSAIDLALADAIHVSAEGLARLGRRLSRLALSLTGEAANPGGPSVESAELVATGAGMRNGARLTFSGMSGRWSPQGIVRGFDVRQADWEGRAPMDVVDARVLAEDTGGTDILVILSREPEPGTQVLLSYGMGINPACTLVDEADMPLCAFAWRPILSR